MQSLSLFFDIFGGDFYFEAFITELFYICLVISQREKIHNLAKSRLVGIGVGGNYVRRLVITVISIGRGGAMGCGGFKVI